jgi:hypothetical protein
MTVARWRFSTNSKRAVIMGPAQIFPPVPRRGFPMAAGSLRLLSIPLAVLLLAGSLVAAAPAQAAHNHGQAQKKGAKKHSHLTLEQAVARVQNETGGKVLKADSRNTGHVVEYRIKVLTPDGHVRVITLRSDQRNADSN